MLVTSIVPTIFTNDSSAKATTGGGGNVNLDYNKIYETLETLSYAVFNKSLEDYGIRKGRDFGTVGDLWAAGRIEYWMKDFSTNLTGSSVTKELINYSKGIFGIDHWKPHKADITGFSLQLKDGTNDPFPISTNESFPIVPFSLGQNPQRHVDFTRITNYSKEMDNTYPLDEYDYLTFNVTYTRINDQENLSEIGVDGELAYIENYSNASTEDIEGRVHLLNISDSELNDTLDIIAHANATGFILIKNNPSTLQGWEVPIPGVAVSEENGSIIKSYILNESLVNVSAIIPEIPIPAQGNLEIYYYNSSVLCLGKQIFLINQSVNWSFNLFKRLHSWRVVGVLYYSGKNDPDTHWESVPNVLEVPWFFNSALGTKISMKQQLNSYSSYLIYPKPTFYINRTIYAEDGTHLIDDWVEEPNEIYASFWLNWSKNDDVTSYNVYCTVPGKDPSKTIIISGGHYDGFWGQMSCDDAAGVAVMLGILKYMNDHHITPTCNLVFIAFSGEEYIDKGSRGYVLRHWNDLNDIKYMLNLDVIAPKLDTTLFISSYNRLQPLITALINKTVAEIAEWTNYETKTGYQIKCCTPWKKGLGGLPDEGVIPGTDAFPFWLRGVPCINFGKDPFDEIRHQTGSDHTKGDVMNTIDRVDLENTSDLFWNITRYFCVDPDCQFIDIDPQSIDTPNDNNAYPDAVQINYTINTTLPQDRVMVKAILFAHAQWGHPEYRFTQRYITTKNYTLTPTSITDNIIIELPHDAPRGFYTLKVYLYNSTGIVNNQVYGMDTYDLGVFANQKHTYFFYLRPPNEIPSTPKIWTGPTGQLKAGITYSFNASATDPEGDHVEYQWNWRANKLIPDKTRWQGPFPSGINHTMTHSWDLPGHIEVRVRARDTWRSSTYSNWSDPWVLDLAANYGIIAPKKVLTSQNNQYHAVSYGAIEPIQNYTWDFDYESKVTGKYAYVQNPYYTYTSESTPLQILTVKDALGQIYTCNHTLQVLNVIANYTTNQSGAPPNKPIKFNDTSTVYSGAYLNNWTWEFGDQTPHSHNRNVTHAYTVPGTYNVTLTAKDNLSDSNTYWQIIHIETNSPDILYSTYSPDFFIPGSNITLYVDIFENESGIKQVNISITKPDNETENHSMSLSLDTYYDYEYSFNDTWQPGQYNYTIWAIDNASNINHSSEYCFIISTIYPEDDAENINTKPYLTVHIDDPNEDVANVSYYEYFSDSFVINSESEWKQGTFINTRTDGNGNLILINETSIYGTGTNNLTVGNDTIATLVGNSSYYNVTVHERGTLRTQGYILRVRNTLKNLGTITDSYTGGSGGSGGPGGYGGYYESLQHYPPHVGDDGSNGSAPTGVGKGGHGGGGGGGGGAAWGGLTWSADGGNGGNGGDGGKGGGSVKIFAFKLNNQGVIHANGTNGENGTNGTPGGYAHNLLNTSDAAGGGGGCGGGGNGGDGGHVNITYAVLINSGNIYAAGGGTGLKGSNGAGRTVYHGTSGGTNSGASWGDGGGHGGHGGNGSNTQGVSSTPGYNGANGENGDTGQITETLHRYYVSSGTYSQILDALTSVEWTDPLMIQTTPNRTSVLVTYGENISTPGSWTYYEDITSMPACRWLKIRVNLSTDNLTITPSVDKITISTRKLLNTTVDVPHGTNASYRWTGRALNTTYHWQVRIFNNISSAFGPAWDFKTIAQRIFQIDNVSNNPDTVGFGYPVIINANVTENDGGLASVKANITYPDNTKYNLTMNHVSGNWYQYVFDDTWLVGQYNCTIWAQNDTGIKKSSTGHHFHVTANATLTVCTIKDSYGTNETLDLTDPSGEGGGNETGSDDFWVPYTAPGMIGEGYQINYLKAWKYLLHRINYTLEAKTTGGWYQANGLTIQYHNVSDDQKKYTLVFNAMEGDPWADYRVTFVVDIPQLNISLDAANKTITITHVAFNHLFCLNFNYGDIASIPGLQFSRGVLDGKFWFRIQRNHVLRGTEIVLDPSYQVSSSNCIIATSYGNSRKLACDSNGVLFCVYLKTNTKYDVYLAYSNDSGVTWTEQRLTMYTSYDAGPPAVAIDGNNLVHIIYANKTGTNSAKMMYRTYNYTTKTVSNEVKIGDGITYFMGTLGDLGGCNIIIDGSNNVHVVWEQITSSGKSNNIRYQKKTGTSWGTVTNLSVEGTTISAAEQNYPTIISDKNNNLYVYWQGIYTLRGAYKIRGKMFWSGNSTWSKRVNITTTSGTLLDYHPSACVNLTGKVFLTWMRYETSIPAVYRILFCNSTNGLSFGTIVTVNNTGSIFNSPSVSCDNSSKVHVMWGTQDHEIWYRNTSDGGSTWGSILFLLTGSDYSPNSLWAMFPLKSGKRIDVLQKGYAFIWTKDASDVYFMKSSDIIWNMSGYPFVDNPSPENGSTGVALQPVCSIDVYQSTGKSMTVTWQENSTGSYITRQVNSSVASGSTVRFHDIYANSHLRWYWWKIYVNDGATNKSWYYRFRTVEGPPMILNPQPANGSTGVSLAPKTNITVNDPRGEKMTIQWLTNYSNPYVFRPDGDVMTQLSSTGANHYTEIDEATMDTGDYVYRDSWTSYLGDRYSLQNHSTQSYSINNVTITAYFQDFDGCDSLPCAAGSAKLSFYIDSTYYNKTVYNRNTPTDGYYHYGSSINPSTGMAWTWDDIDDLQVAVWMKSTGWSWAYCYQLYVEVNPSSINSWYEYGRNFTSTMPYNGTYRQRGTIFDSNGQTYWWKLRVNDSGYTNTSDVFWFYTGVQSKLVNRGSIDMKGYLLMQVQFFNETLDDWVVADDTINQTEPEEIPAGFIGGLDTVFNGLVNTSDLLDVFGEGTYRIYTAFRDPDGAVLICDDETKLEAVWEFMITRD